MAFTIRKTDIPDPNTQKTLLDLLITYNASKTGINDYRILAMEVTEEKTGKVIGGLWGRTAFGWLFTELLFVPESLRGQGVGRSLMLQAEREALARGCHSAWLDTFAFQAREFYERLGYTCFGELPDYPEGFSRFFMKKKISGL